MSRCRFQEYLSSELRQGRLIKGSSTMHLRSIELFNFRLVEHLRLDIGPRLTLLVGPNGAGKTAVLDAVSIGMGAVPTRLPGAEGRTFKKTGDIRLRADGTEAPYTRVCFETAEGVAWDRTQRRDKSRTTHRQVPPAKGLKDLEAFLDETIIDRMNRKEQFELPLFAYYGVHRALLELPQRRTGFKREHDRIDALAGAHEATSRFRQAFMWFYNKENEEMREQKRLRDFDATLPELDAVRRALRLMFPELSEPHIQQNPLRFMVNREGLSLSVDQLSDGYRTLFGMVVDLAVRMSMGNPHLSDPLESSAIVMIDEVDLHLHPEWQRRVLTDLLRTFPNTQFLMSTHSPFIIEAVNNSLKRHKIDSLDIQDEEIDAIFSLPPADVRAYAMDAGKVQPMLDGELGLLDNYLLEYLNAINAVYDRMRDIEWEAESE